MAEFATVSYNALDWQIIDGPLTAMAASKSIMDYAKNPANSYTYGDTNFSSGLEEANKLIDRLPFQADRIVVDIVGDGVHNSQMGKYPVADLRKRLLDKGVTINGLPLMHDPSEAPQLLLEFYKTQVVGGPSSFLLPLNEMSTLPVLLRQKIIQELY